MTTVREALRSAIEFLSSSGLDSPCEDAELIIATITKKTRTFLFSHPEYPLQPRDVAQLHRWLRKRAQHYPIQYLRGVQEFYGREFLVSPAVLIPRPETELVVDTCLELLGNKKRSSAALDIGTGSGCIAITLLLENRDLAMVATDLSAAAVDVARSNAAKHACGPRIELLVGDATEPVIDRGRVFDLVVSNPPYVPFSEETQVTPSVTRYEPRTAVFAGCTGLEIYSKLFTQTPSVIKQDGFFVLELGHGQSSGVSELAQTHGWIRTDLRRDLAGIERCAVFCLAQP